MIIEPFQQERKLVLHQIKGLIKTNLKLKMES